MKIILLASVFGLLFTCSGPKNLSEEKYNEEATFKTIIVGEYSAKRSGKVPRDEVFSQGLITTKKFNSFGHLVEYEKDEIDGEYYEKTFLTKNDDDKLIESRVFDRNAELKKYTTTEFDKKGYLIKYYQYDNQDILVFVQENEYDDNGNIVKMITINYPSLRTFESLRKYNSDNLLIEKIRHNADGTINSVRTYKYDKKGNEVLQEMKKPNGDYTKFVSTYDNQGNILTQHWFDKEDTQKHWNNWEYIYDEHKNWITKRRYSNGELGYVWERKI